jgi:steroid delta-isomerase-like uncharacterized protein
MASPTEIAKSYFQGAADRDVDAMVACWAPGGLERFVGEQEVLAPEGVREYFTELFGAFPDFRFEVLDTTASRTRVAVRWRASGTFAGPGAFQGFAPNGARIEIEGCDVLTIADELIQRNDAYFDGADLARQLGFLPPAGSPAEAWLTRLANLRTRLAARARGSEGSSGSSSVTPTPTTAAPRRASMRRCTATRPSARPPSPPTPGGTTGTSASSNPMDAWCSSGRCRSGMAAP